MPDPMRIRATSQADGVEVRILMSHEMETGLRRDATGKLVPPHFIQSVLVTANGRQVLSAEWGTAIAKNPFVQFKFKDGKQGDKISVTWLDNHGETRTDEASVS